MTWTFGGVDFDFQMQSSGVPTRATLRNVPRLIVRPLLGSSAADIASVGFEATQISGAIYVAQADRAALVALNGTEAILTNGTITITAVMQLEITDLDRTVEGSIGNATFYQARP